MRELQQKIIRERSCTGVTGLEHGNTLGEIFGELRTRFLVQADTANV
jgi:hypothetical protein